MAPPELRPFLDRSFVTLERETPRAYERLCHALFGLAIRVIDGDSQFALRSDAHRVASAAVRGDEPVVLRIERGTLLALTDGLVSIEEALREDGLFVGASVSQAAATFDALRLYLNAAIRCRSFPALLSDFRTRHPSEPQHDNRTIR